MQRRIYDHVKHLLRSFIKNNFLSKRLYASLICKQKIKKPDLFLDFPCVFRNSRPEVLKMFLKISQNSQENTCARVSFFATLLKKRLWHKCFPVSFAKFSRAHFNTSSGCFCVFFYKACKRQKQSRKVFCQKKILKISQFSLEKNLSWTLSKKRLQHKCFHDF